MSKKRTRVQQGSAIPETLWRRGGFFEETTITLRGGDCREIMRQMAARGEKVHAIVTDPPYELGFAGKAWDSTGIAFDSATWKCCLDVLLPGGHLVAFGGTRTFHRIAVAIEDAGFEIRDELLELFSQDELGASFIESLDPDQRRMLFRILGQSGFGGLMAWMYGKGFPKSRDVSKAIDQEKGAKRGRVRYDSTAAGSRMQRDTEWDEPDEITGEDDVPVTAEAAQWHGWGTALKPAWEPIILARKPLDGNVAENVLRHGAGGINIVGCQIGKGAAGSGRWPANVVHDGSDDVEDAFAAFGVRQGVPADAKFKRKNTDAISILGKDSRPNNHPMKGMGDTGTASRFFFSAKAGEADRVTRNVTEVLIEWTSGKKQCRAALQVDTGTSLEKAIGVSGSTDVIEWSTFLSGNGLEDLCRTATSCTIRTGTSWTTTSTIWNWLMRLLTSACIQDVVLLKGNGLNPAEDAMSNILSATIMLGKTASLPGANSAASHTPLKISVNMRVTAGHPTVKPIALMRWLVRLVAPHGGIVLDPFGGSGTTGAAALIEGMSAILLEREEEYQRDIARRMDARFIRAKR